MQTSAQRTVGCIGKCTFGLSNEQLDLITDNINKTLEDPRGIEIFRRYLERRGLTDNLDCLSLYETSVQSIEKEKNHPHLGKEAISESLIDDVNKVRDMAEDLDGVPEIDMALMERFNEALTNGSRIALLEVLRDTCDRTRNHLRRIHGSFQKYASEPCPLSK